VDGHVWQPADGAGVEDVLGKILDRTAPRKIAVSDPARVLELVHGYTRTHPDIGVVPWSGGRAALVEADVGVTLAQHGIAETGTLILESSAERHRLVSLLPAVHIALLPATAILGTLGEALTAVRDESGAVRARAITFITGPSRTADIELTLVVGVHGPKELHVILTPENAP
jgi:L-lactate utilization protein LutC